jgi:hypothetical protein
MQYSPRLIDAISAFTEVTVMILGEEERATQIDREAAIVALDRNVEQIAARQHRDARVVDQAVDAAEGVEGLLDQLRLGGEIGDVGSEEGALPAPLGNARKARLGVLIALQVGDHEIEARLRQGEGDGPPDAAPPAGHERSRSIINSGHRASGAG